MEIADRFELRERIGGGVMSDVYRALDHTLGHEVLLRIVRVDLVDDEFVDRFQRDAEAASDIRHPNVVSVLDHGVIAGRPFYTRELVSGSKLEDLLARSGELPGDEARWIAEQIARGVGAAHERGVLHRDVSARNVFVTGDGVAKVVDFGRSTAPLHPAPEQVEGGTIDERVDVYGIGAVLYQMLTGKVPIGRPTPPRRLARRVSKPLLAMAMRALERDPAKRYASAEEMARALRGLATTVKPKAVPVPASPRPVRAARSIPIRRRVAGLGLALLALPLLLALLVGVFGPLRQGPVNTAVHSATTTPRPTSTLIETVARTPDATLIPPVETTPQPTREPSPEPTAAPTVAPPVPPPPVAPPPERPAPIMPAPPGSGTATVLAFYDLIEQERFDAAAALWSPRMQANYPPATNIYGRFDRTRQFVIRSISPMAQTSGGASVAIDILEVLDSGVTRRWVGHWYLVWDGTRWLMDAPSLRAG
jgi:serine/threonine protein kinase